MSYLLALLLVAISTALMLRLGRTWPMLVLLILMLGGLAALGAEPLVLGVALLLGLGAMWVPRSRSGFAPRPKPAPRAAKTKNNPKISTGNSVTGLGLYMRSRRKLV